MNDNMLWVKSSSGNLLPVQMKETEFNTGKAGKLHKSPFKASLTNPGVHSVTRVLPKSY